MNTIMGLNLYKYCCIGFIGLYCSGLFSSDMVFVNGGVLKTKNSTVEVESFYMDKFEVTMAEFEQFVEETEYLTTAERSGGNLVWKNDAWVKTEGVNWRHNLMGELFEHSEYELVPVSNISVEDAKAYSKWAGKRLPTVEEWVYAASGGVESKGYKYSGSNKSSQVAWSDENVFGVSPQAIGQKEPNELGLYDMSGNVHEFVLDGKHVYARGGCFFSYKSFCEINNGGWKVARDESFPTYGFRCVRSPD